MKKAFKFIAIILICSFILTGCWDQRVFEQVGFILSFAIEESQNGKLLITSAYPLVGGQQTGTVDVISTETVIIRGGRTNMRLSAPKLIEGGKVQTVLLSDSLAKKGIHDMLELFQRDATLPAIAFVTIVEGSPGELLKKTTDYKNKPRVSFYIYQLLENNVKLSNIPNTKVFDFDINFFAPGLDPIVPIIKVGNGVIQIAGSALFSGDKMTGRIDVKETNLLLGMMEQFKYCDFIFDDPDLSTQEHEKYGVSVSLFKPKRKIKIDFNEDGLPVVEINLKYKCNIDEYEWDKTMDPTVQKDMEKKFDAYITKKSNEIIKKLQEANCDPIGIGDMIRSKYYDYWQQIDWKEMYRLAEIKVTAEVDIGNVGIIK